MHSFVTSKNKSWPRLIWTHSKLFVRCSKKSESKCFSKHENNKKSYLKDNTETGIFSESIWKYSIHLPSSALQTLNEQKACFPFRPIYEKRRDTVDRFIMSVHHSSNSLLDIVTSNVLSDEQPVTEHNCSLPVWSTNDTKSEQKDGQNWKQ